MCPDTDTPLDRLALSKCILIFNLTLNNNCSTLVDEYGYLRHRKSKPLSYRNYFDEADSYFDQAREYVRKYANIPFDVMERVSLLIIIIGYFYYEDKYHF